MTMQEKINELLELRVKARLGGGEKRIDKQHSQGKFTARERILMFHRRLQLGEIESEQQLGYRKGLRSRHTNERNRPNPLGRGNRANGIFYVHASVFSGILRFFHKR